MKDDPIDPRRVSRYAAVLDELERGVRPSAGETPELRRMRAVSAGMLAGLAGPRLVELTSSQRARALEAMSEVRRAERGSRVRRLVARLAAPPERPALALRSSGAGAPFHALYELEGHDLDLYLGEDGALLGQILPRDGGRCPFDGGLAVLQAEDSRVFSADIERDGEFCFPAPPAGRARLALSGAGLQVLVEDMELPAP